MTHYGITRRNALCAAAAAASATMLPSAVSASDRPSPHHAPQAKHVVVLYMSGGYSHVDTFDPKPRLIREHDLSIGSELRAAVSGQPKAERFLKAPLWRFE